MSCYHLNKIWWINGQGNRGLFTNGRIDHLERRGTSKSWVPVDIDFVSKADTEVFRDFTNVPCGQCIGCRLDKARAWQVRLMLEARNHQQNYFITLTYDDEHVPRVPYGDTSTGEVCGEALTLCKRDLQLFFKRLRSYYELHSIAKDDDMKYYACGEYGDSTMRPHYHVIMLGLDIPDLKYFSNHNGHNYYTSEILSALWKNGHVLIGQAQTDSIGYVARYCTKKLTGKEAKEKYNTFNLLPPFAVMSKGIGYEWYSQNFDKLWETDSITLSTESGHFTAKPSRYFLDKLSKDDENLFEEVKHKRLDIANMLEEFYNNTNPYDSFERLEILERNKLNQVKSLKRSI